MTNVTSAFRPQLLTPSVSPQVDFTTQSRRHWGEFSSVLSATLPGASPMRIPVLSAFVISLLPLSAPADDTTYDVVIYGGTSAGVIAAVQSTHMGKSVVIVAPETHLGGLTAGGWAGPTAAARK